MSQEGSQPAITHLDRPRRNVPSVFSAPAAPSSCWPHSHSVQFEVLRVVILTGFEQTATEPFGHRYAHRIADEPPPHPFGPVVLGSSLSLPRSQSLEPLRISDVEGTNEPLLRKPDRR